jgi:hypothetical protein
MGSGYPRRHSRQWRNVAFPAPQVGLTTATGMGGGEVQHLVGEMGSAVGRMSGDAVTRGTFVDPGSLPDPSRHRIAPPRAGGEDLGRPDGGVQGRPVELLVEEHRVLGGRLRTDQEQAEQRKHDDGGSREVPPRRGGRWTSSEFL